MKSPSASHLGFDIPSLHGLCTRPDPRGHRRATRSYPRLAAPDPLHFHALPAMKRKEPLCAAATPDQHQHRVPQGKADNQTLRSSASSRCFAARVKPFHNLVSGLNKSLCLHLSQLNVSINKNITCREIRHIKAYQQSGELKTVASSSESTVAASYLLQESDIKVGKTSPYKQ